MLPSGQSGRTLCQSLLDPATINALLLRRRSFAKRYPPPVLRGDILYSTVVDNTNNCYNGGSGGIVFLGRIRRETVAAPYDGDDHDGGGAVMIIIDHHKELCALCTVHFVHGAVVTESQSPASLTV